MSAKPNNISTGIPKLNEMIEGGFPESTSVLLYGTPGVGKSIFCQQFLYEGLKNNEKCIFLTFDVRPETIETSMSRFGWETKNKIIFLDCFSYRIGAQSSSRYALTGLSDLNQLSMIFDDIMSDGGKERKRIVVDSLSTLLLYTDPELSLKFLKDFIASAISQKSTLVFTIEEGIHDEKTVAILNYMAEGLIEMKFNMDKRMMRVAKMRGTAVSRSWAEFEVTKKGIVII